MKLIGLICKIVLLISVLILLGPSHVFCKSSPETIEPVTTTYTFGVINDSIQESWWSRLPKEKKMLYTTGTSIAVVGIWGLATWDFGSDGFHFADEGMFEKDSKNGGADKFGHFWATYAFSDSLTGLYKYWGYPSRQANIYAVLSAWTVQLFIELGDATSETQGFSWQDLLMNSFGSLASLLLERYPELDRKIDFRVEYIFNVDINNFFDDYSNQFYSMVLKLEGFDSIENSFLKYIELQCGYYSRGYDTEEVEKFRNIYIGISLNFSRLFKQNNWKKTGKFLEYVQIPYTVPKISYELD